MKYRKKPIVIEAVQWFKHGDNAPCPVEIITVEGRCKCDGCEAMLEDGDMSHGRIGTLEGSHRICPGDWIITGVKGEHYPCKPDIFEQTYEKVAEARGV